MMSVKSVITVVCTLVYLIKPLNATESRNINESTVIIKKVSELTTIIIKNKIDVSPNVNQTRPKRVPPLHPSTNCNYTLEEVTGVLKVLSNYLNNQTVDREVSVTDEPTRHPSHPCQEAIQGINKTSAKIIALSNKLQSLASCQVSLDSFNKSKNAMKEYTTNLIEQIDMVRLQSNQEAKKEIDLITGDIQAIKVKLDTIMIQLENSIVSHQNDLIALCIYHIGSGKIDSAVQKYQQILDHTVLSVIIDKSYKSNNITNILNFITQLPCILHKAMSYQALVNAMNTSNEIESHILLVIIHKVKLLMEEGSNDPNLVAVAESKLIFEKIEINMKDQIKAIIDCFSQGILQGHYESALDFAQQHPQSYYYHIGALVSATYKPNENTEAAILKFSKDLPFIESSILTYSELVHQMKKAHHSTLTIILCLARQVRELMLDKNYSIVSPDKTIKITEIWNNIPSPIQGITTGEPLCISNEGNGFLYYLVVGGHFKEKRDSIMTSVRKQNKWKFQALDEANKFMIKSVSHNMYLYAAGYTFNRNERRVLAWRPGNRVIEGEWEIIDHDWRNGKFYLFNTHWSQFLNNGVDNQGKDLYALTWRGKGKGPKPIWNIDRC